MIKSFRLTLNSTSFLLCFIIFILLTIEVILNFTPPVSRDALIHHLAIPKLWINNGGFYETKWASFSYYPMNIDLLYLLPIYCKMDYMAKFIHMLFGIGTAILLYIYLKKKMNIHAALIGVLIFLSTPIIFRLSTEAYVDLGLTFFITASILSFTRYCDGQFKEFKWLFFSALAMGIALGTKYNALIAWCFLTAAIVFVYSKETNKQLESIKLGSVFFIISLILFSPWLIKNIILTGNPLFPLFRDFLNINRIPGQEGTYSIFSGTSQVGIFQMREVLYGESFWETLLIPIRYFFQGQDNNPRYFDGVLNPILIILPPFAFLNKSFMRDKLLFAVFSIFFILTATFLDQIRIRYIAPVIPFLSILAAMGFINVLNWTWKRNLPSKQILAILFISFFVGMITLNIFYIKNYYQEINPTAYILGKESRDEFISRHSYSYPAMKFINETLPKQAKIRLLFLARRGYYLDRIYEDDPSMGMTFIRRLVSKSNDSNTFQEYIRSLGYTHFLVRIDLYNKFLKDNYPLDTINVFMQRINNSMDLIYNKNGYAVYQIKQLY